MLYSHSILFVAFHKISHKGVTWCGAWALPLSSSGLLFNYGFLSHNNRFCSKF